MPIGSDILQEAAEIRYLVRDYLENLKAHVRDVEEQDDELALVHNELDKLHKALDSQQVCCPTCGGKWMLPKQFMGDPRFDCPHCRTSL